MRPRLLCRGSGRDPPRVVAKLSAEQKLNGHHRFTLAARRVRDVWGLWGPMTHTRTLHTHARDGHGKMCFASRYRGLARLRSKLHHTHGGAAQGALVQRSRDATTCSRPAARPQAIPYPPRHCLIEHTAAGTWVGLPPPWWRTRPLGSCGCLAHGGPLSHAIRILRCAKRARGFPPFPPFPPCMRARCWLVVSPFRQPRSPSCEPSRGVSSPRWARRARRGCRRAPSWG